MVINNGAGSGAGSGSAGIHTFGNFNQHNSFINCTVTGNGNVQFLIDDNDFMHLGQDSGAIIEGGTYAGTTTAEGVIDINGAGAYIASATINGQGADGLYLGSTGACVNNNKFGAGTGLSAAISSGSGTNIGSNNILNGLSSNLASGNCNPAPTTIPQTTGPSTTITTTSIAPSNAIYQLKFSQSPQGALYSWAATLEYFVPGNKTARWLYVGQNYPFSLTINVPSGTKVAGLCTYAVDTSNSTSSYAFNDWQLLGRYDINSSQYMQGSSYLIAAACNPTENITITGQTNITSIYVPSTKSTKLPRPSYQVTLTQSPSVASSWSTWFNYYEPGASSYKGFYVGYPYSYSTNTISLPSGTLLQDICTQQKAGSSPYVFSKWASGSYVSGLECNTNVLVVTGPMDITANYTQP